MHGNRHKLRLLYLILCASQLTVTGLGLAIAYQIQSAYARNIEEEKAVNEEHRAINELETLARVVMPGAPNLEASSMISQLSQTTYTAKVFLRKVGGLVADANRNPRSPIARSKQDLQSLVEQMTTVGEQSQLASEAWSNNDAALAQARLTYVDRAATRVQAILGHINLEMSHTKDEVLISEGAQAKRASIFLRPLAILGILTLIPALLYAWGLDRDIWAYEVELEDQRRLLEERVVSRTSELQSEINYRKRMEAFNDGRNHLMEKVVEGNDVDEILAELTGMTEQYVSESQCLILLGSSHTRPVIAPSVSSGLAAEMESALMRKWDAPAGANPESSLFTAEFGTSTRTDFPGAWSQGFRRIIAGPIMQPRQPVQGGIVLMLRDPRVSETFVREVLMSASRIASVALEHARMQGELFRRAHHDPLTGLPNRGLFEDRLQQSIALADRRNTSVGVLCVDLDGFKQVNDRFGHPAGDWLLQQVAHRLSFQLRKSDTVARLGGDEFVAIVHDSGGGDGVAKFSETLVRALAEPYTYGSITLNVTACIGVAVFPRDGNTSVELCRNADLAMYRAKDLGGNTFHMFSSDLADAIARRKQISGHLRDALEKHEFDLCYQPIYTVSRNLVGFEALVRFRRPELQVIPPSEFIPVAEQSGQVVQIGEWVLREACRQGKQWEQDGFPNVSIAVNVSAIQLARPDFARLVSGVLRETGLEPSRLHVEITETAAMSDFDEVQRQLFDLASLGVPISIDDFGTGHSSLSYVHRMPIQILKVDRSFVRDMIESRESKAIVCAIIAMAQSLGLSVIAEGVENEKQLGELAKAGCDMVQGYLFSPAVDNLSAGTLLRSQQHQVPSLLRE